MREQVKKATDFARKILPCKSCGAVIVAAGSASRMAGVDKIMADLRGEPLILHTVRAFQETSVITEIVIVTRHDLIIPIRDLCHKAGFSKVKMVLAGGKSRQESVTLGLGSLSKGTKLAAIQDGARPLVSPQLIDRTVRAAAAYGAAAPGVPVKDTIKEVKGGIVRATPDRSTLFAAQTPQVFDFDLIRGALEKAKQEEATLTDDCSAVERMGMSVRLVQGDEENFKVTTRQDLLLARVILEGRT